jgi:hypothetical protein
MGGYLFCAEVTVDESPYCRFHKTVCSATATGRGHFKLKDRKLATAE